MVRRSRISEEITLANEQKETAKIQYPSISYFTLYRFSTKCDRRLIAIALVATFIAAISQPYAIILVASTFQDMITYAKENNQQKADSDKFLGQMHRFGVLYSCVGVIIFTGGYLGSALMNITAINQIYRIRQAYLRAALNQDFAYFDLYQTGDFASKMADDVIRLEEGMGDKVSALVYNLTMAVACVSMAFYKGWKLALMCLTTAPVTFILVGLTGKLASQMSKKEAMLSGKASSVAQEVLGSIRTVYAFNGQQKELRRYKEPLAQARKIKIKKELFTGFSMGFLFFCVFGSYALSFYVGIYLVINDPQNYNADVMFSVFFGVMAGMSNLGMVGSLAGAFGSAKGAGAQIFHLIDNVPTINPLLDRGLKPKVEGNIELKDVMFKYPARPTVSVLNGVSFKVNRGQSVALVGHSGCGKSSIISLISRYYDVLDGSVRVDGYDVRELSVSWLRAHIGLVSQEPALFSTSVRENIRYGRDGITDEDVEAAAKKANAHNFIVQLSNGYNTQVGERGTSLSGGQKQRIAIARALVRNPRILLLDEATSALDISSEAKVQKALEKAAEGRTTITVAHRLSTIRNADVIYVMKNGNVIELGSHEQLMTNRGHYFDMVVAQEPNALSDSKEVTVPVKEDSDAEEVVDKADTISMLEERSDVPKVRQLSFWRVIRLNSPEWKCITVGCVGSILIGFALPLFIVAFGDMFGAMSSTDPALLMEKGRDVARACVVIGVVVGVSNLVECLSFGVAGAYLTERLRSRMFAHLLQQHVGYFDERANSTGALCARLSAEAAYVQGATGQRIGVFLQGVGSVGLALVLAMVYQWKVGLVAVAFCPVLAAVIYHQARETGRESRENAVSLENSTKVAMEAVANMRAVASLGRERRVLAEYAARLRPALAQARRAAHGRGLVAAVSRSMFNFINSAALTYGGHLIVAQEATYDNILVTTQSFQMASGQLQNAFTFAPDFQKGIRAASRIVFQLAQKPKICDPATPAVTPFEFKGNVSFKDVAFRYPTRPEQQVLRGFNMQVDSGKTVALVGASGCGKSTVVQLLNRFYDPDQGVVCLDKWAVPELRVSEVRGSLGLVAQEPALFALSVRENIAYGDNSREPSAAEVVAAAKLANIHDFIVSLPQGYETNIGSCGVQLSGGQRQRVALARALVRAPRVLLLDEATSALDVQTETAVLDALESARSGRTCVVVAHRAGAARRADLILAVEAGRAVEAGSHHQLLRADGLYAKLYHAGL